MSEYLPCAAADCLNWLETQGQKRFCRGDCRLRTHRAEVRAGKVALPHRLPPEPDFGARVRSVPIERRAVFCYADPPYPGRAHLYPENEAVDHRALIASLVADYPDGWALSTSSETLREVLPLCPAGVRVGSWHRQHRPDNERPHGWEPVIFCGGRRTRGCVPDTVVAMVPPGWDLPGRKPERFYWWVFDFLGLLPGDRIVEPFPGSGAGEAALQAWLGRGNVSDVSNVSPE